MKRIIKMALISSAICIVLIFFVVYWYQWRKNAVIRELAIKCYSGINVKCTDGLVDLSDEEFGNQWTIDSKTFHFSPEDVDVSIKEFKKKGMENDKIFKSDSERKNKVFNYQLRFLNREYSVFKKE
jgi:hypothetical protein